MRSSRWWWRGRRAKILEELLINKLLPRFADAVEISITVGYSEESGQIDLTINYNGESYNPFTATDTEEEPLFRSPQECCVAPV
jgi:hypothetical protein